MIYALDMVPNQSATVTDASGVAYIGNANVGALTVDATMGGTAFYEHTITARAGTVTTTAIEP